MHRTRFTTSVTSLLIFGLIMAVGGVAYLAWSPAPATADMPDVPAVQLTLGDAHNSTPHHPGDCAGAPGSGDLDCAQVAIPNYVPAYGHDFRICLQLFGREYSTPNKVCTPWASQNGGLSPITVSHSGQFTSATVTVEPNPNDNGDSNTFYTDVGVGIQLYYSKEHTDSCRGSSGMAWSYGPTSGWAYGEVDDDDPGCAQVGLHATQRQNPSYNAAYAHDSLPDSLVSPSDLSGSITMRNIGNSSAMWTSDRVVESHGDCSGYQPAPGSTCTETKTWESSAFRLKLIGGTLPGAPVGSATYPYRHTVTLTYSAQDVPPVPCDPTDPIDSGGGGILPLQSLLTPRAYADRTICPTDPVGYETVVSSSGSANIASGDSADVPVDLGTITAGSGDYTLIFQMIKTDGAAPGTASDGLFGETFTKRIHVEGKPGFSCTTKTLNQTVTQGDVGTFDVSVDASGGFGGNVTVTANGLPQDTTAGPETVTVPVNGSNDAFVSVETAPTTPAPATTTIGFTASAPGHTSVTCGPAQLVVQPRIIHKKGLDLSLKAYPPVVHSGGTTTLDWTVHNADFCNPSATPVNEAWTADFTPTDSMDGEHIRVSSPLHATTTFTLLCAKDSGGKASQSVTVGVSDAPPPGATLRIDPKSKSFTLDDPPFQFRAYYDPDGSGPEAETPVTGLAATDWSSSDPTVAAPTANKGEYAPTNEGTSTITVSYSNLHDDAVFTVAPGPGGCDNPPSLTVSPTATSTAVGGTVQFRARYNSCPEGPRDVTQNASWRSLNTTTASSQGRGLFKGEHRGTAPVSASYLGVDAPNATLTVTTNPGCDSPPSLTIAPTATSTTVGGTVQFAASYNSCPEGPRDVTQSATWRSLNTTAASSQGRGLFKGEHRGTAPVSSNYLGVDAPHATLTVTTCKGLVCLPCEITGTCPLVALSADLQGTVNGSGWQTSLSGSAPLGSVTFRGTAHNGSDDTMNFTLYCDRADNGTNITPGYAMKIDGTSDEQQLMPEACTYDQPGTYAPKLIIERGTEVAQAHMTVRVSPITCTGPQCPCTDPAKCPLQLSCTFSASPSALFIPPSRTTNLSWQCSRPAACTVTNKTDGGTVASSATGSGSGTSAPQHRTTYNLNCENNAVSIDKTVNVFDTNTLKEILPK